MFDSNDALQHAQAAHDAPAGADVARRALSLLDLTSLNDTDTPEVIADLCRRAQTPVGPVAAVCVYPRFVAQAVAALRGTGIRVATVVNFPGGDAPVDTVLDDSRAALEDGADEIDVVLPYQAYLEGRHDAAFAVVSGVCALCRESTGRDVRVKVILETGRLCEADVILAASRDAIAAGVDFLKTSTGKIDIHATPEACVAMLQAIVEAEAGAGLGDGRRVGLKVSGGIRTPQDAARYLALADAAMGEQWATPATFRFGASGLLDALLATLEVNAEKPTATGGY